MSIRNVDNEESKVKPKRSLPPSFARPFKELCHGQEQITGKMLSRPQISFHGQIHVIDTIDIADQHAASVICKDFCHFMSRQTHTQYSMIYPFCSPHLMYLILHIILFDCQWNNLVTSANKLKNISASISNGNHHS
eukprot:TRINITY_DN4807_c0_g1_i1.p1 TRINITY_DN4807_c0_g1~~TRINITY_DN4807_c0_g1_i1.p1  ORF type:complete len:136 (-),score=15.64 TRINITY_DN4807_c0_g1_i1:596-1003(-)